MCGDGFSIESIVRTVEINARNHVIEKIITIALDAKRTGLKIVLSIKE